MKLDHIKCVRVLACVAVLASSVGVGLLAGCETVKGVGKDITNASEATERAISK